MGWISARTTPDSSRDVVCRCKLPNDKSDWIFVGWYFGEDDKWTVYGFSDATVLQWRGIPKGWKRKEKK